MERILKLFKESRFKCAGNKCQFEINYIIFLEQRSSICGVCPLKEAWSKVWGALLGPAAAPIGGGKGALPSSAAGPVPRDPVLALAAGPAPTG